MVPQTQNQVESRLAGLLGAGGLTTDATAWANPALVDFVRDSPMTRDGLAHINSSLQTLRTFTVSGPSFRPGVPPFQLSGAL